MTDEKTLDDFDVYKTLKALKSVEEWSEGLGDAGKIVKILTNQKSISKSIENANKRNKEEIKTSEAKLKEIREKIAAHEELETEQKLSTQRVISELRSQVEKEAEDTKLEIVDLRAKCESKKAEVQKECDEFIVARGIDQDLAEKAASQARQDQAKAGAAYAKFKESIK
jgi:hypothetical protein